jgi:ABC-2 type transport system permease protein
VKVWAFCYKNWIMAKRNVFTLVEIAFWPVIWLVSVGLMTLFLALTGEQVAFMLVGVISLSVVQVCQLDVAYVLLFDVWSKSIKHSFIAPIRPYHPILGAWLMGVFRGSLVFLILSLFSHFAFRFDFLRPGPLPILLFLLGLYLSAAVIGITVCILVLCFGQRAEVAAWSLVGLTLLFSGIYYPVTLLPEPFRWFSELIPLTYFLDDFRTYYGFLPTFPHGALKGTLLVLLYWGAGMVLLGRAVRRARRTGILLKLSE